MSTGEHGAPRDNDVVWWPTAHDLERSRLRRFMAAYGIDSLVELQQRSVSEPEWFWDAVVKDLDLAFFSPYDRVLDMSRGAAWPRWFPGGRYNYVWNALDRHAQGAAADRTALVWDGGERVRQCLTYAELASEVDRLAWALHRLGIARGDRVGLYMPMAPAAVIGMLACGKLGAVVVPIFSGYAAPAVAARLRDCGATAILTLHSFPRRGNVIQTGVVASDAASHVTTVRHVIELPRITDEVPHHNGTPWPYGDQPISGPYPAVETEPDEPCMIIYTSGTTGRPKGAVHGHAGFPIKATQDLAHCFDLQQDDTLFWLTDIGWMMGPWAICGALTLGATLLLYDGLPDHPHPGRLWELVERHRVTVLGVSPTLVRAMMAHGNAPPAQYDLASLRAFGSTGEPWNDTPWRWLFDVVGKKRCPILNYSGGTEISGGIVGGFTITPLRPCAFAGPVPGVDADVVDEQAQPVHGQVGELVIRSPWVGMTQGFWHDPERYEETYWSRFPGIWVHGDWALIENDAWYIVGRSDDTIKLAGKRVGPAEVESAAVSHAAVGEAAAIGVPHDIKGETLCVYVVLRAGQQPSEALREEIRDCVTMQLGRALRPETIRFTDELPRTRNGKILRRVVRSVHLRNAEMGDLSSMENGTSIAALKAAT